MSTNVSLATLLDRGATEEYAHEARFHVADYEFCKAMVDGLDLSNSSAKKVLELGPSLGHLSAYLVRNFPNVQYHATDRSTEFLRRTKRCVTNAAANEARSARMTFAQLGILDQGAMAALGSI
ncbi:hypothetical protein BDV97DRAFT_420708 [Delphinella strobiligena]|nr:hypothetical protein BDV97DRAFT_420708 [Delphinella strobiligena]